MPSHLFRTVIFVLLSLPALMLGFIGFKNYDDEGLFIFMSLVSRQGVRPYRDYLLEYGPVFHWSNSTFFSLTDFSHYYSRLGVLILVTIAGLIVWRVGYRLLASSYFAYLAALCWIYVGSPYFCESLHPGWYVCVILSAQAYLLWQSPGRLVLITQGILLAVIAGFKPHLGVAAGLALSAYYSGLFKARIWGMELSRVFTLLLALMFASILVPAIKGYGVSIDAVYTLAPFVLLLLIFAWRAFLQSSEGQDPPRTDTVNSGTLFALFASAAITLALIYATAGGLYGFNNILESLILQPARRYYALYPSPVSYAPIESGLFCFGLLSWFMSIFLPGYAKVLRSFAIYSTSILCASGTPGNLLAWSLVFVLYLPRCRSFSTPRTGLWLLAASQLVHAFPLPAAQVTYATVISWLLLFDLLSDQVRDLQKYFPSLSSAIISLPLMLCLPMFRGVLWKLPQHQNYIAPCQLAVARYSEDLNYAREFCQLTQFLSQHTSEDESILTVAGFFSLNLSVNRPSTANFPAARWSYLPPERIDHVLEELDKTAYAVVHHGNSRLSLEHPRTSREPFDTRILAAVESSFTEVDSSRWIERAPKYFKVYENGKIRGNTAVSDQNSIVESVNE